MKKCKKILHKTTWGAAQHILLLHNKAKRKLLGISYCSKCSGYHVTSNKDKNCIIKSVKW